jgi:hypothetical protein
MNLYKLSQTENNDYDTYDSCIVAEVSEELAAMIHPDSRGWVKRNYPVWASTPNTVHVELIGTASAETKSGVILASFNAG